MDSSLDEICKVLAEKDVCSIRYADILDMYLASMFGRDVKEYVFPIRIQMVEDYYPYIVSSEIDREEETDYSSMAYFIIEDMNCSYIMYDKECPVYKRLKEAYAIGNL